MNGPTSKAYPARAHFALAGLLVLLWGATAFADGGESPAYEVWYSLTAEVHGAGARADIQAGGRLLMSVAPEVGPEVGGGARLELVRPLVDPWKLYWVDPFGPFGEEIKLATVKTLSELSWEALETAQEEVALTGRERHALWLDGTDRERPLDGAFGFIVIGPPAGRFAIDIHPTGNIREVTNRLTDRWLSGPFGRFVGTAPEETPHGYWFWNQGETEPFEYEPHTYHAMAAALELLALPLPSIPTSGDEEESVIWNDPTKLALEVLTTVAPKIGSRLSKHQPTRGAIEVEGRSDGHLLAVRVHLPREGLRIDRETMLPPDSSPPESDRLRLRLESPRRLLEIDVGYARSEPNPSSSARPAG